MYQPRLAAQSSFVPVRNARYHVLQWGDAQDTAEPVVMLHGWMDIAASWQFLVDALADGRRVIAPDWRGFGRTESPPVDTYWFADYLADLDTLLDRLVGADVQVNLVGQSMGGNVTMAYAGIRPKRVRRVVNIEGFGMPAGQASHAPARFARWMDEIKKLHNGEIAIKPSDSLEAVARRMMKTNPRLPLDKAQWLAPLWAQPAENGQWVVRCDAAHKIISALTYREDETLELYRRIAAPVLAIESSQAGLSEWWMGTYTLNEYHKRLENVPDCHIATIDDAGHMIHHDQPAVLARMLEDFLA